MESDNADLHLKLPVYNGGWVDIQIVVIKLQTCHFLIMPYDPLKRKRKFQCDKMGVKLCKLRSNDTFLAPVCIRKLEIKYDY